MVLPPTEPYEPDDWKRWQKAIQGAADAAQKCVTVLACIDGACTEIAQVCPAEGADDDGQDHEMGGS